jgi:hypothetical protein
LSDSPKKPVKPVKTDGSSEDEEDIFLKTKAGSSSEDNPAETSHETVDSFEILEEIQLDNSEEQVAPTFESAELDDLSFQELGQESAEQQLVPEFSTSISETQVPESRPADSKTIDSIKNYSESLNAEAPASAQLPFTLRIEGKLTAQESEKLLDVLSREKMDIREVDIEPQLEAGRILIPRISEYAGVLLIQALRGVRAKIYFGPSDIESVDSNDSNLGFPSFLSSGVDEPPSAESLPVTQGDDLPQLGVFQVIDTLIVSGMLSTKSVEALNSSEFTTLTEALMRELKFKAVRRGARGITHLSIQLTPLTLPTDYRVTLSGTAVR